MILNSGPTQTFAADAAYAENTVVKLNADGTVGAAGATDVAIGTLERPTTAAGQPVGVRSLASGGFSRQFIADGSAVAVGGILYQAAAGQVGSTSAGGALPIAIANGASSTAGDFIEGIATV